MHFINHGIMSMYILPQSLLCLAVQIDHLFDMHNIVFDEVYHESAWLVLCIVIDRNICIVLIPTPVLFPCQSIAEQAAVRDRCKM